MNCATSSSLFCTIGRTMRSVMVLLEDSFEQNGIDLNLPQFIILNVLFNQEDLILEDLSKMLHKDKSAVMRNINKLEGQLLVAKISDVEDRRRKVLMLTQKGLKVLENARAIENQIQTSLTNEVTVSEMEIFKRVLMKMNS